MKLILEKETASPEETESFAADWAKSLVPGDIIGLCGDLGAGKTTFTRGLFEGLGGREGIVHSPTFTLLQQYPTPGGLIHHFDLYRLEKPQDFEGLDFEETIFSDGISVIEWADKFKFLNKYLKYRVELKSQGPEVRHIRIYSSRGNS